jgi:hypothetical protein
MKADLSDNLFDVFGCNAEVTYKINAMVLSQ